MAPRKRIPKESEVQFRVQLGMVVRDLRKPEMNQDDFADQVGVYRSHMGLIEQGKLDLRLSTLQALADALGMPLSSLIKRAEKRQEG
ncbi:helix-turn-helix transcriptional regulator [Deinococcus sp.]|uniref:helix-turn-helix domain-containing protein n=1 Tax=Deinococcus sp. TaxID=47478 RepID=UPI0025FDA51E|nr:helix-turn-helix transcriptional regulator [Deinococcus sp.]